jgi:hypothetical protein
VTALDRPVEEPDAQLAAGPRQPGPSTAEATGEPADVAAAVPTTLPEAAEVHTPGWRNSVRVAVPAWIACLIGSAVLTVGAHINHDKVLSARQMIAAWGWWDWGFYGPIANDGYLAHWSADERFAAFFPLFPLLVHGLDVVMPGGPLVAALTISVMSLLGTLVLLHRLVERELDARTARRAVWFLLAFPTAFFLIAPYPSALFLLLAVGALYAMRTGNWWVAGALGALASATRSSGVLLGLPFVMEYVRQHGRRLRWSALAVLLVPAGLVAYALYLQWLVGDALAFQHAQSLRWHRQFQPPWWSLWEVVKAGRRLPLSTGQVNLLDLGAVVLVLVTVVLAFVGPWKLRRDLWVLPVYALVQILFVMCVPIMINPDERLASAGRHVLEVFPMFIMLARMGRNELINRVVVYAGLLLQGCLLASYLNHGWIG